MPVKMASYARHMPERGRMIIEKALSIDSFFYSETKTRLLTGGYCLLMVPQAGIEPTTY